MDDDLDLGVNDAYKDAILAASKRTGMEPQAIAAVINTEAAKGKKGAWNPKSKATTSSARGLTQFLDGTWADEAKRSDTVLGEAAKGKTPAQISAMRDDPNYSIMAAAEYDSRGLKDLQDKGLIDKNLTPTEKAQAAYTAHHEGGPGASTLYKYRQGKLSDKEIEAYNKKAKKLLPAQVGKKKAAELIKAAGGDAAKAYSDWLDGFVKKNIQPDRFRAKPKTDALLKPNNDAGGGPRIINGEPTVLVGNEHREAAHIENPHEAGGKVIEGSSTVFVGEKQLAFARKGDATSDNYVIKSNTQQDVLVG